MVPQIMKSEIMRLQHELGTIREKIKENQERIKLNRVLPHLVSNVIEVSPSLESSLLHLLISPLWILQFSLVYSRFFSCITTFTPVNSPSISLDNRFWTWKRPAKKTRERMWNSTLNGRESARSSRRAPDRFLHSSILSSIPVRLLRYHFLEFFSRYTQQQQVLPLLPLTDLFSAEHRTGGPRPDEAWRSCGMSFAFFSFLLHAFIEVSVESHL